MVLYDSEIEKRQHITAIQVLARDMGVPIDVVRDYYESELEKLKHNLKVSDFLTVIVSRKVKEMIKKMIANGEFLQD